MYLFKPASNAKKNREIAKYLVETEQNWSIDRTEAIFRESLLLQEMMVRDNVIDKELVSNLKRLHIMSGSKLAKLKV